MRQNQWTREETIVAFNVYCKIPFKNSNKAHPLVVEYAHLIGRSPSALNMKIGNLGRLDPDLAKHGITGLAHGAALEQVVWNEFHDHPDLLAYESERIIAALQRKGIEESAGIDVATLPTGTEREAVVRQRVSQEFFRAAVLSAYNYRCCISGVTRQSLLEACHISGWAADPANRTNPKNGLCMNPFLHRAYDQFLLSVTPDLTVAVSEALIATTQGEQLRAYLSAIDGTSIAQPCKFQPDKALLAQHYERYLATCNVL